MTATINAEVIAPDVELEARLRAYLERPARGEASGEAYRPGMPEKIARAAWLLSERYGPLRARVQELESLLAAERREKGDMQRERGLLGDECERLRGRVSELERALAASRAPEPPAELRADDGRAWLILEDGKRVPLPELPAGSEFVFGLRGEAHLRLPCRRAPRPPRARRHGAPPRRGALALYYQAPGRRITYARAALPQSIHPTLTNGPLFTPPRT